MLKKSIFLLQENSTNVFSIMFYHTHLRGVKMPVTKRQAKLFRGSKEGGTNDEKSNVYIDIYSSYYYFYFSNKIKKWHLTHLNKMPKTKTCGRH
jgi:hypothetical protein